MIREWICNEGLLRSECLWDVVTKTRMLFKFLDLCFVKSSSIDTLIPCTKNGSEDS